MTSKESLVAQRGGQRASATKMITSAKVEMGQDGGVDLEVLDSFCKKLAEKLQKIKIFDSQILENLTDETEIAEETLSQDDKNLEIEIYMAKIDTMLKGAKKGKNETVSKTEKGGPSFTKLSKWEIKCFSGDPLEFPTFRQQFEASIGNSNLAEVAKFSYLKNLLRGEASRVIMGLSVTGENYMSAWDTLTQIFGRKTSLYQL